MVRLKGGQEVALVTIAQRSSPPGIGYRGNGAKSYGSGNELWVHYYREHTLSSAHLENGFTLF